MPDRPLSTQSSAAWWRIVPKKSAKDHYVKRFESRDEAEHILLVMKRRRTHKVVGYNAAGKRLAP